MRTLDLRPLAEHTAEMRQMYPMAKIVLWASLECTNFSRAKGGQPRDADSRTLAEHLFRYIEALTPDYIQIENVEEFMSWGDLDENGKPISRDKGRLYTTWVDNVKAYGYKFDHRILKRGGLRGLYQPKAFLRDICQTVPTYCMAEAYPLKDRGRRPFRQLGEVEACKRGFRLCR